MESNDSIHNFWFVFFVQFSKVYLVALLATHISYHLHTTFVNKMFWKSFLLFYTNNIVLTTWISYHLAWVVVNKNLKFLFFSLSPSTSNLYILPLIGSLVNDIPIYFSIFLQMFIERLILRHFYGSVFDRHLAFLVIFLATLKYHLMWNDYYLL